MVSAAISPTRQSIAEQSQALEELFASGAIITRRG